MNTDKESLPPWYERCDAVRLSHASLQTRSPVYSGTCPALPTPECSRDTSASSRPPARGQTPVQYPSTRVPGYRPGYPGTRVPESQHDDCQAWNS
eukprot:3941160-Rhodomonas_salina.2